MRKQKTVFLCACCLVLLAVVAVRFVLSSQDAPLANAVVSQKMDFVHDDGSRETLEPIRQEDWMVDLSFDMQAALEAQSFIDAATVVIAYCEDDPSAHTFTIVLDGTALQAHVDEILALIRAHADALNLDFPHSTIVDTQGNPIHF